ncbi:MAG: TerB family tellurite resistance protein [Candidatus Dadabacteria bacterium]|nr:TerB family tellurite resistance protein [Candidatus Dadabacteria bacterium]
MLGVFKNIFDGSNKEQNEGDRELKLRVATCVLLLEAATADSNFSSEEQEKIIQILKSRFQMDDMSVKELIDKSTMEKKNSTDLWYFTNLINKNLDNEEKYNLMELVWEVIYSDGTLDKFENYIAHKLLNMLNLDHSRFIELKMKVKNEVETA